MNRRDRRYSPFISTGIESVNEFLESLELYIFCARSSERAEGPPERSQVLQSSIYKERNLHFCWWYRDESRILYRTRTSYTTQHLSPSMVTLITINQRIGTRSVKQLLEKRSPALYFHRNPPSALTAHLRHRECSCSLINVF